MPIHLIVFFEFCPFFLKNIKVSPTIFSGLILVISEILKPVKQENRNLAKIAFKLLFIKGDL
jgi:hypothetical protein